MKIFSQKRDGMYAVMDRSRILNPKSSFTVVEEYKTIRTNIMFSIPEDGCKIIGISSPEALEGKSINSLNLAITFAETGARVLLLECDLRLPRIARMLMMVSTPGISNLLVGLSSLDEVIRPTGYQGLDVILSGNIPPNPSELLGSEKMGAVLEKLKGRYDYILVDTPPVNVVSDAAVLSKYLSGMVLVVRSGVTEKDSVKAALERLGFVNANILGFILNAVPEDRSKRGYKYEGDYGHTGGFDAVPSGPDPEAGGARKEETEQRAKLS